ncbi:very long chain fatty acid elongase 5-like isoform X2 [Mytilus edulis]|uniref:very long chain fatty acid elongase 5-like isoform X2 n=1 Tax=Mytilus edulis TaxID=6550 RepID=UPI0039F08717
MKMGLLEESSKFYEWTKETKDPRTRNWFLLNDNPIYVILIVLAYYFIVWQGPKFMKNRKPYELQTFMIIYNWFLVILSAYMTFEIVYSSYLIGYFSTSNPLCAKYKHSEAYKDPKEMRLANVLYIYFLSKILEFMDTFLMIMRKKDNQITYLHVYHHSSILIVWWIVMTYMPGGQSWMSSSMNCLVHVVMYAYYALAAIPSMRSKLWWKKYITKFQLTQFTLILLHTLQSAFTRCDFPKIGEYMLTLYMISMLVLFGNFYIKSYNLRQMEKAKKDGVKLSNGKSNGHSKGHTNGYAKLD